MRESEKNLKALQTMLEESLCYQSFWQIFDSGLLSVVHYGDYSGHFGIG